MSEEIGSRAVLLNTRPYRITKRCCGIQMLRRGRYGANGLLPKARSSAARAGGDTNAEKAR